MSSYAFPASMSNEVRNRQVSLLEQLFGRGQVGSLGSQPSEQPRVGFGGGLAVEPQRPDGGSGGTIAEISTPRRGFGGSGGMTPMIGPGGFPQQPRRGFGGYQPRGFGGFGGYGGMGMNPMMGMGLGGGFGMGYPQMGGYGYGFGQGMGGFPRGGYGGYGGFGGGFRGYGSMGGYGMSPYQNQFQNQGMMNQGLGVYNRGMMQPQQQQQAPQPQVQPMQQPMQAQQATPMQQQYQQAFY
jgi:hypothetical protein